MDRRRFLQTVALVGGASGTVGGTAGANRGPPWTVGGSPVGVDRSGKASFVDVEWSHLTDHDRGLNSFAACHATDARCYFVGSKRISDPEEQSNGWVFQTDYDGTVQWRESFDGSTVASFADVCPGTDGVVVAGTSVDPTNGDRSVRLLELDRDGTVIWDESYADDAPVSAQSVTRTADDGYLITLNFRLEDENRVEARVLKVDGEGSTVRRRSLPSDDGWSDYPHGAVRLDDGGYLLSSRQWTRDPTRSRTRFVKLSAAGDVTWRRTYDEATVSVSQAIAPAGDSAAVIVVVSDSLEDEQSSSRFLLVGGDGSVRSDVELPRPNLKTLASAPFGYLSMDHGGGVVACDETGTVLESGVLSDFPGPAYDLTRDPRGGYLFCGHDRTEEKDANDDGTEETYADGLFGRLGVSTLGATTTTATGDGSAPATDGSTPSGERTTEGGPGRTDSMLGPLTTYYAFAGLVTVTGLSLGAASYHYWLRE